MTLDEIKLKFRVLAGENNLSIRFAEQEGDTLQDHPPNARIAAIRYDSLIVYTYDVHSAGKLAFFGAKIAQEETQS